MERMSRPSASPARIGPQPASNAYNVQYRSSASRRIISIWSLLVDEAPTHQARSNGLEIMSAYRAERRLFTPWRGRREGLALKTPGIWLRRCRNSSPRLAMRSGVEPAKSESTFTMSQRSGSRLPIADPSGADRHGNVTVYLAESVPMEATPLDCLAHQLQATVSRAAKPAATSRTRSRRPGGLQAEHQTPCAESGPRRCALLQLPGPS